MLTCKFFDEDSVRIRRMRFPEIMVMGNRSDAIRFARGGISALFAERSFRPFSSAWLLLKTGAGEPVWSFYVDKTRTIVREMREDAS
jgi:hypothetical protein